MPKTRLSVSAWPLPRVFPQMGSYFLRGYDLLSFLWLICGGEDNQKLTAYHVVSEKLEFADLLSKASQSWLPTLLTNYSILVTNNSEFGFAVDNVLITETDVFVDTFIAIDFMHLPLILKCMVKSNISLAAATLHLNQNGRFFPLCSLQLWLTSSRRSLFFRARVLKWANNFSITVGPFSSCNRTLFTIEISSFIIKLPLITFIYFEERLKSSTLRVKQWFHFLKASSLETMSFKGGKGYNIWTYPSRSVWSLICMLSFWNFLKRHKWWKTP